MKSLFFIFFLCLSLPGFTQEDDEQMIEKIEEERKKQAETAIKLQKTQDDIKNAAFDAPEELKKLGYETVDAVAMMDEKVVKIVKKMLEQSTLKNSSEADVKKLLLDKYKGGAAGDFLANNPRITNFFVDVLRDEKALSSIVGIFLRREDLKLYACIWLGFMMLGWLFKKIFFKKKWSRVTATLMGLIVSLSVTAISLTTFFKIFEEELTPTTEILVKHWKKRHART